MLLINVLRETDLFLFFFNVCLDYLYILSRDSLYWFQGIWEIELEIRYYLESR